MKKTIEKSATSSTKPAKRKYTRKPKEAIAPIAAKKDVSEIEARRAAIKHATECIAMDRILAKLDESIKYWTARAQANCLTGQDVHVWLAMIDDAKNQSKRLDGIIGDEVFRMLTTLRNCSGSPRERMEATAAVASQIKLLRSS